MVVWHTRTPSDFSSAIFRFLSQRPETQKVRRSPLPPRPLSLRSLFPIGEDFCEDFFVLGVGAFLVLGPNRHKHQSNWQPKGGHFTQMRKIELTEAHGCLLD